MDYMQRYHDWLTSTYIDETTKEELHQMQTNTRLIEESFYCDLEFGTGGLRGIIGPGTNRMNKYTVRKATQGLANFINKLGAKKAKDGVAIAYDSRNFSQEFAEEAALVLNANGITAYIFDYIAPTPLLSFAVRELHAAAGIVVTASHNPPQYNGYKVYLDDGGQVVPDVADLIIAEVNALNDFSQIKSMSRTGAEAQGLFKVIGPEVETAFIEQVKSQSFIDEIFADHVRNLKIIFTPLHGTGNLPVRRALQELGFCNVKVVPEQELPDGNFPTVKYPNPEERDAFELAIAMAQVEVPDLIIGTDPDCDRIGVVEQIAPGQFQVLTGNQVGILLTDYILSRCLEHNKLPKNGVVIKTIVTTDMVNVLAEKYGVAVINTLTGFKFIGEKIKQYEETGEYQFLLGFEESYGYLVGTHARDKDAVVAAAMICEMAAYYKSRGITLYGQLLQLMEEHGYYLEDLSSIQLEGIEGQMKIQQILADLRLTCPAQMGSLKVLAVEDYQVQKRIDFVAGETYPIDLPTSNVLKFFLEDKSTFTIRPSGTEPKVKIYFTTVGRSFADAEQKLAVVKEAALKLIK